MLLERIANQLDCFILPLKIEWKHEYRREKIQLYPSEKFCEELQAAGAKINHETTYQNYFDWVLYDGNEIVLIHGIRDFSNNQEISDEIDTEFLDKMDKYADTYKYFSLYLWLDRKLHKKKLDPEHVK